MIFSILRGFHFRKTSHPQSFAKIKLSKKVLIYSILYVQKCEDKHGIPQSEKSGTIRESNQALGVRKAHYAEYYERKKLHFVSRNWCKKISSVACGFSPINIHFSDYQKSLISRINEVFVFFNKILL